MQRDLFDIPAARLTDPVTSHEAADRETTSGKRAAHTAQVLELLQRHPGSTAVELWSLQNQLERHEVSRRLSDLKAAGLAYQGEVRACTRKGTRMVTWYSSK